MRSFGPVHGTATASAKDCFRYRRALLCPYFGTPTVQGIHLKDPNMVYIVDGKEYMYGMDYVADMALYLGKLKALLGGAVATWESLRQRLREAVRTTYIYMSI